MKTLLITIVAQLHPAPRITLTWALTAPFVHGQRMTLLSARSKLVVRHHYAVSSLRVTILSISRLTSLILGQFVGLAKIVMHHALSS